MKLILILGFLVLAACTQDDEAACSVLSVDQYMGASVICSEATATAEIMKALSAGDASEALAINSQLLSESKQCIEAWDSVEASSEGSSCRFKSEATGEVTNINPQLIKLNNDHRKEEFIKNKIGFEEEVFKLKNSQSISPEDLELAEKVIDELAQ